MLISIREPEFSDEAAFIQAMSRSRDFHCPWTTAPITGEEFREYFRRHKQVNNKSFLVVNSANDILGVFNISEIVRGCFQNAYLGYYAVMDYAGKGYMSQGLKLILEYVFDEMELHRLEANIQPENTRSIELVKKNGFKKEGFSPRYLKINNHWRDHERWAMTVEDWKEIIK